MLDIETLSTQPNATILTIGAIKFDLDKPILPLEDMDIFYERVSIESCEELNMHIDPVTQRWWDKQEDDVRYEALEHPERHPITQVLNRFCKWYGNAKKVYANSPNFDCVIMEQAFRSCNIVAPWKFWEMMDVRTILSIGKINLKNISYTRAHNALHDSYKQIIGVVKAVKNLGL